MVLCPGRARSRRSSLAASTSRSRRLTTEPCQAIAISIATSAAKEMTPSLIRLDPSEDTGGVAGLIRGSAPFIARLASGGDMVIALVIAPSASTVRCSAPADDPPVRLTEAPPIRALLTCAAVRAGNSDLTRAATPATIALAAQVPFIVWYPVGDAATTFWPAAVSATYG
jgi:hypothetical protein